MGGKCCRTCRHFSGGMGCAKGVWRDGGAAAMQMIDLIDDGYEDDFEFRRGCEEAAVLVRDDALNGKIEDAIGEACRSLGAGEEDIADAREDFVAGAVQDHEARVVDAVLAEVSSKLAELVREGNETGGMGRQQGEDRRSAPDTAEFWCCYYD